MAGRDEHLKHLHELITQRCGSVNHPEVRVQWANPAVVEGDARPLIKYVEDRILAGTRFEAGQTFQVGWMITKIGAVSSTLLELQEPDFRNVPIQWTPLLDHTLNDLRRQRDVVESVNLHDQMDFPSIGEAAQVVGDFTDGGPAILRRVERRGSFSGWMIFFGGDETSAGVLKSLYEIAMDHPGLVQFFALPRGSEVVLEANRIAVSLNGLPLAIADQSYLAGLKATLGRS